MKNKIIILALLFFCSNSIFGHLAPDLNEFGYDNKQIEKYVAEGQRQYQAVLEHNRLNYEMGCPEKNVYFFSADVNDTWIDYILLNGGTPDILNTTQYSNLHEKLVTYNNNNPDKTIYVCLTSQLTLKVSSLWTGATTVAKLVEHYNNEGLGETASAANVNGVDEQWEEIVAKIAGFAPNTDPSYTMGGSGYSKYTANSNRLLLATARIHASTFDQTANSGRSMFAYMNTKEVKGFFSTHKNALDSHISSYGEPYSSSLERSILAAINFVEDEVYDPANVKATSSQGGMVELYDMAIVGTNTNPANAGELAQNGTYLYDYAGMLSGTNNATIRQEIIDEMSGTAVYASTKLKFYITDSDTPLTTRTLIENINLSDPVHDNSLIVWVDFVSSSEMKTTVRYSDDLKNIHDGHGLHSVFKSWNVSSLISTALTFSPLGGLVHLKSMATFLRQASSVVTTFLTEHKIPETWYDITNQNYNSKWKTIFSIMCPAMYAADLILSPILSVYSDTALHGILNGGLPSDVAFAFVCGIYNGFVNELAGVTEIIKLISGAFVNAEDRNKLSEMISVICSKKIFSLIKKQIIQNHSGLNNAYKLAEQIGKDVIFVCIAFVPMAGILGSTAKLGKLGKFVTVCTKIANALDKVNPIFYAMKGVGFATGKVGSAAMSVTRLAGTQLKVLMDVTGNIVKIGADFWKNQANQFIGGAAEWVVMAKLRIENAGLKLQVAGMGNINAASIYFMKRVNPDGTPKLDADGNPQVGVGSQSAEGILGAIKQQLKTNFNLPESLADDISQLPSAIKLYNNSALKAAIDALPLSPVDLKIKFFEDLKAGGLAETPASHIGKNIEGMSANSVKGWEALLNVPDILRRNFGVIKNADDLITAGFTKADITFAGTVMNKFKNNIPNVTDDLFGKFSEFLLEARKYSGNFNQYGILDDVFGQMDRALASSTFKFPDAAKTAQYMKEMAAKMRPNNSPPNPGFLEQLNEALRLMDDGGDIVFEKGIISGAEHSVDIMNKATQKAIHYKAPVGIQPSALTSNLKSAAKQFRNSLEPAPQGYSKIAKVKLLDSAQPDFGSTLQQLKTRIQQYVNSTGNVDSVLDDLHRLDEIQIVNQNGLNRFKVQNTVVSIIQ